MARQGPDGSWVEADKTKKPSKSTYPPAPGALVQGTFDWGDVDGELLARAVGSITGRGDAVSYARNRSATQGSITILSGNERPRYTFSSVAEAEDWIQEVLKL